MINEIHSYGVTRSTPHLFLNVLKASSSKLLPANLNELTQRANFSEETGRTHSRSCAARPFSCHRSYFSHKGFTSPITTLLQRGLFYTVLRNIPHRNSCSQMSFISAFRRAILPEKFFQALC